MRTLIKDLSRVLPNTLRVNRGKLSISGVAQEAIESGADRVIIVERHKGNPGSILFYRIILGRLMQVPPQIYLNEVKTQDELGERKSIKEGLIITTPSNPSTEIKRLASALSDFLRTPYLEEPDTMNFKAAAYLSPTPKYEAKISFGMLPMAKEIGPVIIVKYASFKGDAHERNQ